MGSIKAALSFAGQVLGAIARDRVLWRIAWRNVWRNGRRTAVVVAAIAVGIAGVVLSMAIQFGMVFQMVETAIATDLGHLQIHAPGFEDDPGLDYRLPDGGRAGADALSDHPEVAAWSPRIRASGLIMSPRSSAGIQLIAIEPGREAEITVVAESVTDGVYLDGEARRVLVGEALAERLHVKVGSKVVVSATDAKGDLAGEAFRVAGLYRTASLEMDRTTVFVRLAEAQKLLALGDAVSELVVRARDRKQAGALAAELEGKLGSEAEVRTWRQLAPLLVYFVDIFDQMAWIVYAAVFIAMAFGIANVLLMAVFERTREIGVMRSIGMNGQRVVALVTLESLSLVVVGVVAGFALTGLGLFLLRDGIDLSRWAQGLNAMGIGTTITPVVRSGDLVAPVVVATITALLAGLWPALRASRSQPADALRHV
jgi:ABC-type lipoprotein release transport system permease subunit